MHNLCMSVKIYSRVLACFSRVLACVHIYRYVRCFLLLTLLPKCARVCVRACVNFSICMLLLTVDIIDNFTGADGQSAHVCACLC